MHSDQKYLRLAFYSAKEAGLLNEKKNLNKTAGYMLVLALDPSLAMAGLRMEVSRRLRQLATKHKVNLYEQDSLYETIELLKENGVLDKRKARALHHVRRITNSAVHHGPVHPNLPIWISEIGPPLLAGLDRLNAA